MILSKMLKKTTLRQLLTVPYVALVLLAACLIGWLSYDAGSDAVDTLADRVLYETVSRIGQAVEKHVSGSEAVLETSFPEGVPAPESVKAELEALRTRLWLATSVHLDPNNYAYYGNRKGEFIGLWRYSSTEGELRLRTDVESNTPRSIYRFSGMRGELKSPVLESRFFDPRERPWYKAGQNAAVQTWTSIYIDFKTLQLVGTRARRVSNAAGDFEGVVATDLSLHHLNTFLKGLKLSPNAIAFIVEPDGNLVATSRGPHLRKGVGEDNTRLNAAQGSEPLMAAAYKVVRSLAAKPVNIEPGRAEIDGGHDNGGGSAPRTSSFEDTDGRVVQTGYARLSDKAGLDWLVVVAVPRDDYMSKVTASVRRTIWLSLLACILISLTGMGVLNLIAGDLKKLAEAAREMGEGSLVSRFSVDRKDEIGALAKSFTTMQTQLFTDRLTGISNREALVRRVEDRVIRQRRSGDQRPFAVLFIDLNGFKKINDQLGHDVGDRVLTEIAQLLVSSVREGDMAARFGGDEFVVLLDNVANRAGAVSARDNLETLLSQPLKVLAGQGSADQFKTGAAIGVAFCPDDGVDIQSLLKHADEDMYLRKGAKARTTGSEM